MSRTREEAIAAGIQVQETKHSMKRRKPWHNYHLKGTYMLTLVVEGRKPVLGRLLMPTQDDCARVELSELGKAIFHEEAQKISQFYKMVEVWKLCIMPDHIHMVVRVKEDMPNGKHLGDVVRGFKTGCTRAWWRLSSQEPAGKTAGGVETTTPAGFPAGPNTRLTLSYCSL
jgi:REP element-mobilizing transposase RayT